MPGSHISDQQVFLFMVERRNHTQAVAAASSGPAPTPVYINAELTSGGSNINDMKTPGQPAEAALAASVIA